MGQCSFKKHLRFQNFSEIFYFGMARLRKTNLSAFIQCQYTNILRNKNMEQSFFMKHSKCQSFDEIFSYDMTRLRNTNLDIFIQCQYTKTISRKKNMRQSMFKKHSVFLIFNKASYCDLAKPGTNNRRFLENVFTQKLQQERKL